MVFTLHITCIQNKLPLTIHKYDMYLFEFLPSHNALLQSVLYGVLESLLNFEIPCSKIINNCTLKIYFWGGTWVGDLVG